MTKRIEWADAFKGILILLVVLGHSIQSVCIQRGEDFMSNYFWNLIYSFHMPAFMAMSGYLSYRPGEIGKGGGKNIVSKLFRRFRQLMVPFFIWSALMFLVVHNVEHLYDYILYPNESYWFLWTLFFIVVLFNVIDCWSSKFRIKQEWAVGVSAVLLVILRFCVPDAKLLGIEYVSYYFIYYLLAYYLHKYETLIPRKTTTLVCLFFIWLVLGSFWVAKGVPVIVNWIPVLPDSMLNIGYRIITATVFVVMMFGVGYKAVGWKEKRLKCILEFGRVSLGIYVVHMILRGPLVKWLDYLLPQCPDWILIIGVFAVLAIVSLWIVRLLGKWKFSAIWLLGRV